MGNRGKEKRNGENLNLVRLVRPNMQHLNADCCGLHLVHDIFKRESLCLDLASSGFPY